MFSSFNRMVSIGNLQAGSKSGQIATFLILMIVAVLILILVTVNLGQLSVTAVNLSNAADSAALSLASQLATRANILYHADADGMLGLGKCKNVSILSVVLAVIVAIIVTICTYGAGAKPAVVMVSAVAAGAAGGALGGKIAGTGTGQGALQGAMIGAAIGGGAATMGGALTPGPAAVGAPTYGAGVGLAGLDGALAVSASSLSVPAFSSLGAAAGAGLAAGSELYNAYSFEQATISAFFTASKALNGLLDYDRFRESVFLQALSQIIDDPAKEEDDERDLDGDGEIGDDVLHFYKWWDDRTGKLKEIIPKIKAAVDGFFDGPLVGFRDFAQRQYIKECYKDCSGDLPKVVCVSGPLSRKDMEAEEDGAIIEFFSAPGLDGFGVWKPGPNRAELEEYSECDCGSEGEDDDSCCPVPAGYDEVDGFIDELKGFVEFVDEIRALDRDQLTSMWQSWFKGFYSEGAPQERSGAYYDLLNDMIYSKEVNSQGQTVISGLDYWRAKILEKRNDLPDCIYRREYYYRDDGVGEKTLADNYPCKDNSKGLFFATTDENETTDEFGEAISAIDALKFEIGTFQAGIKNFKAKIDQIYEEIDLEAHGGLNPITYEWADSRCPKDVNDEDQDGDTEEAIRPHKVIVEVGPYKIPWVESGKEGPWYKRKMCVYLRDYSDDGSHTWVRVTRKDPAGNAVGRIGDWNAYDNYDPYDDGSDNASNRQKAESDGFFSVSKVSKARYKYAGDSDAFVELVRW